MSDEHKQIWEMARIAANRDDTCMAASIARALYNADYRKQKVGEWIAIECTTTSVRGRRILYYLRVCSSCKMSNGRRTTNFCPNRRK